LEVKDGKLVKATDAADDGGWQVGPNIAAYTGAAENKVRMAMGEESTKLADGTELAEHGDVWVVDP